MADHDIEPDARAHLGGEEILLASIAISLKRIADWLEGNGPALFTERMADAIQHGIWSAGGKR